MLSQRCEPDVAGKQGALSERPTKLPARFDSGFAWNMDRRSAAAREIAGDQWWLWQALGGVEALSPQECMLVERAVFLRRQLLDYEAAVMHNSGLEGDDARRPLPFDAGTYSSHANALIGLVKALGLERRQRPVRSLRDVMAGAA